MLWEHELQLDRNTENMFSISFIKDFALIIKIKTLFARVIIA